MQFLVSEYNHYILCTALYYEVYDHIGSVRRLKFKLNCPISGQFGRHFSSYTKSLGPWNLPCYTDQSSSALKHKNNMQNRSALYIPEVGWEKWTLVFPLQNLLLLYDRVILWSRGCNYIEASLPGKHINKPLIPLPKSWSLTYIHLIHSPLTIPVSVTISP